MRRFTGTRRVVFAVLAAAVLAVSMIACGGSATPNPLTPTVATITALPSDNEMVSDKTLGPASAPNSIIEYVSFASANSSVFYLTGDGVQIKSQLADTGRAQIAFRNLFLTGEPASAAMLARCAGNAKFFDATTTIFQNQAAWTSSSDPNVAVQHVMLGFGMSQGLVNACLADATLQNALAQIATSALTATYTLPDGTQRSPTGTLGSILAVPAVIVNGTLLFDGLNSDTTANPAFAPTLANIQPFLNK